mgnify:CR=1 FL=1
MLLLLIILSILPILDLMRPGLPVGHDTPDHVARIAGFYQSLSEGNLIPRWAGNLNWGYGHPILMFLYPLPSYAASFFHVVGFSLVDSTKLVFAVSYLASILAMHLFASTAWGTASGVIAAGLYGFAPYRFVDLYVRGAIGEHVAFIFPPLILYGMLRMTKNHRGIAGGAIIAISMAGLILSHNAMALMMLPLILIYGLYLCFFETKNRFRFLLLTSYLILLGFLASAFFWMPAFFEGKYTLRDIVTKNDFLTRFVPWQWFFVSPWNYGGGNEFTKEVGLGNWFAILGSLVVFFRAKETKIKWLIGVLLMVFAASLLLMVSASQPIWDRITILQKFQFPWRFLTISVIISSILGAITLTHVPKRLHLLIVFCLLSLIAITTSSMWRAKAYDVRPEVYYSGIYNSTTDTGESSPIWSVRFMEHRSNATYEVIEGEATIVAGLRKTTRHEFMVSAKSDTRIVDNTLYFPGWRVLVDGQSVEVQFQDPQYRGLMTFFVGAGDHRVVVSFGETKLRKVANILSISGLIAIVLYEAFRRYRHV